MMKMLSWPLFRPKRPKLPLIHAVTAKAPDVVEASVEVLGRARMTPVVPALMLATSGAALLWWTQWARGQAEHDAADRPDGDPKA